MTNEKITAFVAKLRKLSDHQNDEAVAAEKGVDALRFGRAQAYANAARWLEQELKEGQSDIPAL